MKHIFDPAMLLIPYMQNAFASATFVSLLSGCIGFFVIVRSETFATHADAQIGFAGAAGAVLIGANPLFGLIAFALGGAVCNRVIGEREGTHDVTTALLMVAALGAGALFLVLNNSFATSAFALLFGSIVGVSREQVDQVLALGLVCAAALAFLYRPLLFASVNPDSARARGVRVRSVGAAFSALLALSTAIAIPTVGTLLVFSLLVGPAAAASRLSRGPIASIGLAAGIAVVTSWAGIIAAYDTGWPVGFFITTFITVTYVGARITTRPSTSLQQAVSSEATVAGEAFLGLDI